MHTTKTIRATMISITIGTAMYRTILTSFDNGEESPGETTHMQHNSVTHCRSNDDKTMTIDQKIQLHVCL